MPPISIPEVIIDGSLAVIGNITPIGRTKLEQKLATAPFFDDDDTRCGLAAMMTQCSRKLNIPIVDIPDDRGVPSKMDFATWKSVSATMFH